MKKSWTVSKIPLPLTLTQLVGENIFEQFDSIKLSWQHCHFAPNPNNFQLRRDTEETDADNDKRARMRYWGM